MKCNLCGEGHAGTSCQRAINVVLGDDGGSDVESSIASLKDWWVDTALADIDAIAPKAIEYSSQDLSDLGKVMADLLGWDVPDVELATELGIFFYLQGKFSRWAGAIKEGRRPSDDTLLDIDVYVTMARRNRAVGGWPFAPEEKK